MVLKKRLDALMVDKNLCQSRERAKALIMAGRVLVNRLPCQKAGSRFPEDAIISLKGNDPPYVSRGGLKLEAALKAYAIDCTGMICLDVGASTGGFTDCLLQHGARRVYAVDVGYGQLAWTLRQDPRVITIERTNIRTMDPTRIGRPVDLISVDTSFISLKIVVPSILPFVKPGGIVLALIKPQFEAGKGRVGKGGVVRDPALHSQIIDDLRTFFAQRSLVSAPVVPSPILGPKGNREFMLYLKRPDTAQPIF